MNFKEQKPIYMQVADRFCREVIQGNYSDDERVPSVRDYAALVEVNVNTAMRSYDLLQQRDIIYNKRGIGYFVSEGAKDKIMKLWREEFENEVLPDVFKQMDLLGISVDEVETLYGNFHS